MTAARELHARIDNLIGVCAAIEAETTPSHDATPVDEHALVLLRHASRALTEARHAASLRQTTLGLEHGERQVVLAMELLGGAFDRADPVALFARAAIRDGYREGLRHARALVPRRAASTESWDEPALVIEPMATPVTFVRDEAFVAGRHRADRRTRLPFPVVLAPTYPRAAIGALSVLQHEVGHNLDRELELTEALRPVIAAWATTRGTREAWVGWTREIVADALGTLLAGVGLGRELARWCAVHDGPDGGTSPAHPPLRHRVALCWRWSIALGVPEGCPTLAPLRGFVEAHPRDELDLLDDLAERVLATELSALRGGALRDLAPAVAHDHALVLGAAVPGSELHEVRERLLPLVASLRIEAGEDVDAVGERMLIEATRRPTMAASARTVLFRRRAMDSARAPILDERDGGRKVPPLELFVQARTASFVGAVHDRLPAMFTEARGRLKDRPRKQQLEIYFLAAQQLERMAPPHEAADRYAATATTTMELLPSDLLDALADDWAIYTFHEPYFFASYLDVNLPGGRIHISPHGWGQDIKFAPAVDYVWPPGQSAPDAAYAWYREALTGLRSRAVLSRRRGQ